MAFQQNSYASTRLKIKPKKALMSKNKIIGIMGAMHEEVHEIIGLMTKVDSIEIGGRSYFRGKINRQDVVVVFSRWGKVAAASTATTLIREFGVNEIIFTGVAGSVDPLVRIGDVVIGRKLFQHDMDARPLMSQFEIPLLNRTFFEADQRLTALTFQKVEKLFDQPSLITSSLEKELASFQIQSPRLHFGDIASGDRFIASTADRACIKKSLPEVLCVEMEGGSVAQICFENEIPFIIIRTISDSANAEAELDFSAFVLNIAGKYASLMIQTLLSD